jgi:hypothetical protein
MKKFLFFLFIDKYQDNVMDLFIFIIIFCLFLPASFNIYKLSEKDSLNFLFE